MDIANLALDVDHLVRPDGILDALEALLPEPVADPAIGGTHHKLTGSPAPWHAEAAAALLDIVEGSRRLEASLRRDVSGRLGDRRGNSDQNTRSALRSIVRLAEALDDEQVKTAARIVGRWVTSARQLHDVDEADRWEPLPRRPGTLPPPCDYCRTYSLRWNRRTGAVRCCNPACVAEDGRRPEATMEVGRFSGVAALVWSDGRMVSYAHEETAA